MKVNQKSKEFRVKHDPATLSLASLALKCYNEVEKSAKRMTQNTIRVLFVDDDPDYVVVVRHYLRSFQNRTFELVWAADGEKALDFLAKEPPFDLILMDYYLPGANGLEVTKKVRDAQFSTPIILLTSNKDFRLAIEAMKYGIEEYLIKEESTDTVLPRTIVNVLERSNLKKEVGDAQMDKLISLKKTEAVQELVVTMCHEFNNPLAAIKISTDILSRQKVSEEDRDLLVKLNANISILEKQILKLRDLTVGAQ
jgi:CheY-like chemotaxis protein